MFATRHWAVAPPDTVRAKIASIATRLTIAVLKTLVYFAAKRRGSPMAAG